MSRSDSENPYGMTVTVIEGDCISSIAAAHGHLPETIWNDPENERLRNQRHDPNVLLPGDEVFIPPLRTKWVRRETGRRHCFRRKAVPEKLRVQILDAQDVPRAGVPYRLVSDAATRTGVTDDEGYIDEWIAPGARRASLQVGRDEFDASLGSLDPVDSFSGVRGRLANLGYLEDGATDAEVSAALRAFQMCERLDITGVSDDATCRRLLERHGS